MTGSDLKLALSLTFSLMFNQALAAQDRNTTPDPDPPLTTQDRGMQENLEGSIPQDDLEEQQELNNPRIIIHENLQEMPDVRRYLLRTRSPIPPRLTRPLIIH